MEIHWSGAQSSKECQKTLGKSRLQKQHCKQTNHTPPHNHLEICGKPEGHIAPSLAKHLGHPAYCQPQVATVATTATPTSTGPKTLNSTALNSTALYALPNSSKATSKLDLFAMVPEPEGGVGLAPRRDTWAFFFAIGARDAGNEKWNDPLKTIPRVVSFTGPLGSHIPD